MRADIDACVFEHPLFAGFAPWLHWCRGDVWPDIDTLNAGLAGACHAHTGKVLRFVAQTPTLLRDGLHYESRIHERGEIATRVENWHDLLNAMVWCRYPAIKSALNHRQQHDVQNVGGKQRTPAQYAQTLFDEGGAIVVVHDLALIEHWDRHDWSTLFAEEHWNSGAIGIDLFGHALLEHALTPTKLITAKCLVWTGENAPSRFANTADAIAGARCLTDPQELRPLPISGIPSWFLQQDAAFYASADCFRPVREGRRYPSPLA